MQKQLRILMLEDNPLDAELIRLAIEKDGIDFTYVRVDEQISFYEELDRFKADIVLSDFRLPRFNGLTALNLVKSKSPGTPFIIVTGALDEATAVECIKFGAVDYVLKDQLVRLGAAIKKAMELKEEKYKKELAEEALRQSEEKYRTLVENANEAVIVLQDDQFRFTNTKAEQITGYNQMELATMSFLDLIVPQDREEVKANHQRWLLEGEEIGVLQYKIIDRSGGLKYLGGKGVLIDWNERPAMLAFIGDITQRKMAEIALLESEQKFRAFFENAPEYYYIISPEGKIIDVNNSALHVLGCLKSEMMGQSIFTTVFDSASRQSAEAIFQECKNCGYVRDQELTIITRQGERRNVLLSADVVSDAEGQIIHLLFVQRDITERKRTTALLNEQARLLELFFSYTLDCVIIMDNKFNYIRVNNAFARACHRRTSEFPNRNHFDFFPSEPRDIFEMVVKTKHPCTAIARPIIFLKKDKSELTFWDWALVPILDDKNEVDLLIFSMRNVTDRKKAEEELQLSEERFRSLIFKIQAAVMVYDSNKKIVMSNTIAQDLLGIRQVKSSYAADNSGLLQFYRDDGTLMTPEEYPINQVMKSRKPLRDVILGVNNPFKKTTVWILVNADPVFDDSGNILQTILSFVDITERKKHEEQLRELNEELIRSNKELEEFTYVVSHDLKEPLRKMASFSEFLFEDYSYLLDEQGVSYLNRIQDAAERMRGLIDNLLEISRIGTRKKELVVVKTDHLAEEVLHLLQFSEIKYHHKGLRNFVDNNDNIVMLSRLPAVLADPTQLHQVFQNIISNGLKFHRSDVAAELKITAKKRGDWITFAIQDNGIGIEHQYLEKIFIIFQRLHTKEMYPGTGVGLALCKKIIERHNGRIWAESKYGSGSTFYFTLREGKSNETQRRTYAHSVSRR